MSRDIKSEEMILRLCLQEFILKDLDRAHRPQLRQI